MRAIQSRAKQGRVFILMLMLLAGTLFPDASLFDPIAPRPARADGAHQTLPFSRDWTDTSLINTNDDWSGVLGIIGYSGNDLTLMTGVDPQTILADGLGTGVDVFANQTNPNTSLPLGGVAEFEIANPTIALQGHGTADVPHIVLHLNTTGRRDITVSYNLRDIDGSADNAITPVALQYRVGAAGNYTNVPAGFVADATAGPSEATLVTPVSAVLPADANDQPEVYVRIITANAAATNDEWVGIDDIQITGPTAVRLDEFAAVADEGVVLLHWGTGYEVDNLGFNLYRDEGGKRACITPSPVAGSALVAGPGAELTAGRSYAWRDRPPKQDADVAYWLEDMDLNGTSTWHGPVTPQKADSRAMAGAPSVTLDGLNAVTTAHPANAVLEHRRPASFKEKGVAPLALSSAESESANKRRKKQWQLAAGAAVKLTVRKSGWYRVGQPELAAAGLPPDVHPRFLQLYVDGKQLPILVTGEDDHRFGPGDAIEFYGAGLDTPTTDARIYWLVAGPQPGRRIRPAQSLDSRPATARNFPLTVERRERRIYFSSLRNGETENFFGPVVAKTPVAQPLRLPNLDPAATEDALLEVALQGVSDLPGVDHRVGITLNGNVVGEAVFDGRAREVVRIAVPHRMLREGENLVSLVSVNPETDVSLVDAIRLTYRHTYTADDDSLQFTATGGEALSIGGFTNSGVRVMDITNPDAAAEITPSVESQRPGYAIRIAVPGSGARTLLAFTGQKAERAAAITANRPSQWHSASRQADMVIVSHREFLDAIQPLVAFRQSQGLSVAVIDVEDLYDEFSYGAHGPAAVKEFFIRAATTWKRPPRYALFVGDASHDPRNYGGRGVIDFVPTKLIDTAMMETASDEWFADLNADGLAEMFVGRLPARTAAEAAVMVAKIIRYDQATASGGVLLIADRQDVFDFEEANEKLRALVPPAVSVEEIRASRSDAATAKAAVIEGINRGQMIVNFTGHGSLDFWRGNLLASPDARSLTNTGRLSLFVMMTCLNGYFQDAVVESLAEALMKAEGGAVAVWASSGITEPFGQALMNQEFYRQIFNEGGPVTVGCATAKAKAFIGNPDIRRTWILFGDPTTRIR